MVQSGSNHDDRSLSAFSSQLFYNWTVPGSCSAAQHCSDMGDCCLFQMTCGWACGLRVTSERRNHMTRMWLVPYPAAAIESVSCLVWCPPNPITLIARHNRIASHLISSHHITSITISYHYLFDRNSPREQNRPCCRYPKRIEAMGALLSLPMLALPGAGAVSVSSTISTTRGAHQFLTIVNARSCLWRQVAVVPQHAPWFAVPAESVATGNDNFSEHVPSIIYASVRSLTFVAPQCCYSCRIRPPPTSQLRIIVGYAHTMGHKKARTPYARLR